MTECDFVLLSVLVGCDTSMYSTMEPVSDPVSFTLLKSFVLAPQGVTHVELGHLYITEAKTQMWRVNSDGSGEVILVPGLTG